jgi:hypothetical protein
VVTILRPSFVTLRPPLGVEPDRSLPASRYTGAFESTIEVSRMKYLINLVEQENQPMMRVTRPMLRFTSFRALQRVWAGIAVMDQSPKITRERLVVQHSHCICNPTVPKASTVKYLSSGRGP